MSRKKHLIYFLIFIFFNCIFVSFLKADPTYLAVEQNEDEFDLTTGITFNNDGSKMYVVGSLGNKDRIVEYNLTTNYDVSTKSVSHRLLNEGSNTGTNTVLADITFRPHDIRFNNDGTRMYLPMFGGHIETYSLSTAFAISSASLVDDTFDPSENTAASLAMEFNSTGTKVFIGDGTHIDEYDVATAFDLTSTVTFVDKLSTTDFTSQSMAFSDDGTVLFLLSQQTNDGDDSNDANIYEYNLTTGFDLSTATFVEKFNVEDREYRPLGLAFNSDGDKLFITGTDGDPGSGNDDEINTFSLSPKYNLGNPTLTSSVPADNATGVAVDANIILNFSESVNVNSGEITIHKSSDDVKVATIDVTSSNVTGAGTSQITINPTDDLEYGLEYYVLIPASAFVDNNSNPGYSAAISSGALSFTVNSDRTDPTTIKDVIGSIDAQSELAKHYISQSIDTVSNRLRYLRQNKLSNALSKHNLPIHIDVGDTVLTSLVNDELSVNDNLSKNTNSIMPDSWSAWSTGSMYVSKIDDSLTSSSQETEGQAFALGFDKKISDSDFLGFSIQYDQSDTDIGTNGTRIDSKNINLSIYRTKPSSDNKFIEMFLGFGLIKSDLKRVHNSNTLTGSRDGTQIFGSINYGKTFNKGNFNVTPVGRLDLGYTVLDDYAETGINALNYASQSIESGLASFGLEFSDKIQLNENKFQPFGSITYINDFSNSSDAKINYVADTSTIYTYTQKANSEHLISSLIGLTYTASDFLNVNSSYKNTQGNGGKNSEAINFAINFTSNRKTQYMLSLAGNENIEAKLGISKNIQGIDLGFNINQSFSTNPNQEVDLLLTYNF